MKRFQWFPSVATGIAALGLILPSGVFAADAMPASVPAAARPAPQGLDVSLAEGGVLNGQVVDAQGVPVAGTMVSLRPVRGPVVSGYTDGAGRFYVHGLGGGVYEVTAAERSGILRLWAGNASPPNAVKHVLLVAGEPVTRGQITVKGPQGGQWFGGTGALLGGTIVLGALGGVVAGGIITGLQGPAGSPTVVSPSSS